MESSLGKKQEKSKAGDTKISGQERAIEEKILAEGVFSDRAPF